MKGILVTTSQFGPDSYEFTKGKPLTLIGGGELLGLLEQHGYKFRIDLEEARKIQKESGIAPYMRRDRNT
jgi:restriction system protein